MVKNKATASSLLSWLALLAETILLGVTHKCNEELQGGLDEGLLFMRVQ